MKLPRFCLMLILACTEAALADYVDDALAPVLIAADKRDYAGAISELRTLSREYSDPRPPFHLARMQLRAGDLKAAQSTMARLIAEHPDFVDAHYLNGLIQLSLVGEVSVFRKLGKARAALEAWEHTAHLDPTHMDAHYAIFAWYASAPGIAGGDLEQARQLQAKLAEMDPGYGALASARLLARNEQFEKAEAEYRRAIDLLDSAAAHFALTQFYLQTENWPQALKQVEVFAAKPKNWWDPDITAEYLARATAHAGLGNVERAMREAEAGLSLNPNKRIQKLLMDILQSL